MQGIRLFSNKGTACTEPSSSRRVLAEKAVKIIRAAKHVVGPPVFLGMCCIPERK